MGTSYRQNSTLMKPVGKREVHHFGSDIDSANSKFTFTASVETFQDFSKRRESSPKRFESMPFIRAPVIPNPEMESILNSLKPEERDFFNQTMEGRNKIISNANNLTHILNVSLKEPVSESQWGI